MANALRARFDHTAVLADLDEAITTDRRAVAAAPADRPDRAAALSNLGAALYRRYGRTGNPADRDDATTAYHDALHSQTAPALWRCRAGQAAAALAADIGDWAGAEGHLTTVLELSPSLTDHGLSPQDRQHHLAQLQGLASDAARATLGDPGEDRTWPADRIERAWRRLEQARTVLLAQALEAHQSVDTLRERAADLAQEYEWLQGVLTDPQPLTRPAK